MAEPAIEPSDNIGPKTPETPSRRAIREQDDQSLLEYLQGLQAGAPIRVSVVRESPKTWKGRNIEGTLETFDEPIGEDEIRDLYGGGKYHLRVMTPNTKGSFTYAAHRTVKIAGDPKLDNLITTGAAGDNTEPSVLRETLRLSERMVDRAQRRADRVEEFSSQRSAVDPSVELMVRGMQEEVRELRRSLDAKDQRLHELMTKPAERGSTDVLLEKMIDGDSARIVAIRTQHEAELRTMRERNQAEIDRLFGHYEDQSKRQHDTQVREVDNLKLNYEGRLDTLKLSHESTVEGYKREIAHLDRELTAAKTEVVELRTKKDKTVIEQVTEIATVKDALESFGSQSDSGGSTWERIINTVMGSSLVEGIGSRIAENPVMAAPPMTTAPPPAQAVQRVRLPDGRVVLRKPDGSLVELRPRKRAEPVPSPESAELNPTEVAFAVEFMETALRNDTDPAMFAVTARSVIPPDILGAVREHGVDQFLEAVARLNPGSSLATTQHGKNWVREVAKHLLVGE